MSLIGSIIGGIGSIAGGLFGKSSQDKANAANIQLQKDFAQKGIQWKVADAKKAGVHPLAALGASTIGFSPSVVGGNPVGDAVSNMGQDISRAIDSTSSAESRVAHLQTALLEQQIRGQQLDNDAKFISNAGLASSVRRASMVGPPMPTAVSSTAIDGQGATSGSDIKIGGVPIPVPAGTSPASVAENVYGEPGDWLFGALNLLGSAYETVKNPVLRQKLMDMGPVPYEGFAGTGPARRPRLSRSRPGNYGRPISESQSFRSTFQ